MPKDTRSRRGWCDTAEKVAITKRLSDMTDAELAALEARMITIPAALALEHVGEPQADGDTDAAQGGDGCVDDECAEGEASGDNT
jgi:hypothetical protein